LLRGSNGYRLKDCEGRNIFPVPRACFGAQDVVQEEMPMQRAFSIPHVPVVLGELSLASKRADAREMLRDGWACCLLLLRRFIDFMASGGAMS
jgi:hypothetical protein